MCRQEGFLVKVTGLLQCGTNTGPSAPLRLNLLREDVAEVWPHGLGRHDSGFRMETVCEQAPGPFPLTRLHHSSLPLPPAPEKETELTQTAHWWHLGSGHSVSQGYRAVRRIEWCWPAYLASVCYVFRCGCSNWKCPGALYNSPPPAPRGKMTPLKSQCAEKSAPISTNLEPGAQEVNYNALCVH